MIQKPIACSSWGCRGTASIFTAFSLAVGGGDALAQIVLDGKFGTSGALAGPNYNITAAMGSLRGNNLFQSFSQFNLVAGEVATFSGPANVQNILSRVTGGNPSSIDGTIRSTIQGANFFFINPSGILFGPNAAVDVSGAFAASTANYLKLANGAKFVAALDADDSTLSTDPVVAFGFLDGNSGSLEVHGSLKAAPGTSLSLIGGTMAGGTVLVGDGATLEAVNGSINLTGVSAAGEVSFPPAPVTASGQLPPPVNTGGGIVIRGGRLVVENATVGATASGGNINIDLTESMTLLNGGQVTTTSSGDIKGGNIVVNSPSLVLDGQDGGASTGITSQTTSDNPQAGGGNIIVHANSIEVLRSAEISVASSGAADAGLVDITTGSLRLEATDASVFTGITADAAPLVGTTAGAGGHIVIHADTIDIGYLAQISANTVFDANAGTIDITAHAFTIENGRVSTYSGGAGNGGDIHIQSDSLTLDGPYSSIIALASGVNQQLPGGPGGVITINTGSLQVRNDAYISATAYGDGNGGSINITANSILLDTATLSGSGISAASSADFFGGGTVGKGGDITITTGSLTLAHGMPISATTSTLGDGGNINIQAGSITMSGGSSIQSASTSTGRAGTISIQSDHDVVLSGNSFISTSAPQSSGGDISVSAGLDAAGHVLFPDSDIRLLDSQITAQAGPGGGGNIDVQASSLVYSLNGIGHVGITAQAVGDGGNLTIDPSFLILNNSGLISKSTTGIGGNITIRSDYFFQSESTIDASGAVRSGTVIITAPQVDLSASLVGLPSNLLDVGAQLRPDCGVRLAGNVSSFIVLGQGGLPIDPGGFLPSGVIQPQDERK